MVSEVGSDSCLSFFEALLQQRPQLFGPRAGLFSIALSPLASDFLFVEPVLTLTRYTLLFVAVYSIAGVVWWFFL